MYIVCICVLVYTISAAVTADRFKDEIVLLVASFDLDGPVDIGSDSDGIFRN